MTPEVCVLGTKFRPLTRDELISFLRATVKEGFQKVKKVTILHVNVHALNIAYERSEFQQILNEADLVFCDGFGALLGAWLSGYRPPIYGRHTPPDFLEDMARACRDAGSSLFLLAGVEGVAEEAVRKLAAAVPGLRVAGHHGYFKKIGPENDAVVERVNAFRPGLLLVGFGMPIQEEWIRDNRSRLEADGIFSMGACLDFYTGRTARGPRWLTQFGLEWATRLVTEPRRLFRRYIIGNPLFLIRVLREQARRKLGWQ
jgi:N-acetylglucosaminyldiphosphoundecaprenol N-acetyl-beta-D-mannosaminyltransferase